MRLLICFATLLTLLLNLLAPTSALAQAEGAVTWQGEISGVPAWVTIVPRGHVITAADQASKPWQEWGNTETDVYIFAFRRPEQVQLILEFRPQTNGAAEARVFVDDLGRNPLRYSFIGEDLQVANTNNYPFLLLRADAGGWKTDDATNYNLSLLLDGWLPSAGEPEWMRTDGVMDQSAKVGSSQPGIPEWQVSRLLNDPYPQRGYTRFGAFQRMADAPPFQVAQSLLPGFPHFSIGDRLSPIAGPDDAISGRNIFWYEINPTPFYFNLSANELQIFPFPGFQTSGIYAIYSLKHPPEINFEAPFAFYNFVADNRYPQLIVRAGYFNRGEVGNSATSATFRYSWKDNEAKTTAWRYSLDVAGTTAYSQTVTIGGVEFYGVPAEELPNYVVSQPWPLVTFVEATEGYVSSEGMYVYTAQAPQQRLWLLGEVEQPPEYVESPYLTTNIDQTATSDQSLPPGFRGEYSAAYLRTPAVYLSPVDNRLHLLHASGGLWNLGDGQILRVHNMNGDAYIDGWTRERMPLQPDVDPKIGPRAVPGLIEEALYSLGDYVIYSGQQGSEMRKVNLAPSIFEDAPPSDRISWRRYLDRMEGVFGTERDPHDLQSWLRTLGGTRMLQTSGAIWGVRATNDGFRFAVDLEPGSMLPGLPEQESLAPGRYLISYDGDFRITLLTPPAPSVTVQADRLHQMEATKLKLDLRNGGLEDIAGVTLELWAFPPTGDPALLTSQTVSLLADAPATLTVDWQPPSAGAWRLEPRLVTPSGDTTPFTPAVIAVTPAAPVQGAAILAVSASPLLVPLLGIGLALIVLISVVVVVQQRIHMSQKGRAREH